jgi:hypothetical protein
MGYSTQVVDETNQFPLEPGASLAALPESPFKQFAVSTAKNVLDKIGDVSPQPEATEGKPAIKMAFVYRPLLKAAAAPVAAATYLNVPTPDGGRILDSPWVKLTVAPPPRCFVRAVFMWNERQFLLDQALMAGARAWPDEHLLSIDASDLDKFEQDYTNSVMLVLPQAAIDGLAHVSERIPPDILWLFRHALQSTRAPFSTFVIDALNAAVRRATPGYTDLVKRLVDRFFASEVMEQRYETILALADVLPPQHYRIEKLR